ncbi:type ISP restriction/modification enzyme [Streptomyces fildesensis]|uniref:type ISP restriction/modification enzyme n=1 Tax=Streptomyces fildesensis TaxID=375757 RepID=UPI0027DD142F|nr:type ISP restriction/modification enzyme [Streptomyces fildesensis]
MVNDVPGWVSQAIAGFGASCKGLLAGPGEPEAAIRGPLEHLLQEIGEKSGLTNILWHAETRLKDLGVRPDYAVGIQGDIVGYIEVKKPELSIDPANFNGPNKKQWERLRDVPNLMYTNGTAWRLYRNGELVGQPVHLNGNLHKSGEGLTAVDAEFLHLIQAFLGWVPPPVKSVSLLVGRIAPLCRLLRSAVLEQLEAEKKAVKGGAAAGLQPFTGLARDWRNLLFPTADDATFADGYAQAVTFSLLLAHTEGVPLDSGLHEIARELGAGHSLMGKALQLFSETATDRFEVTLDFMVRVIGSVDWPSIRAGKKDAYLHLYEHFLGVYDDTLRQDSGSYYTPFEVVDEMVRLTEQVLQTRLGKASGFADKSVTIVDPAMGTGTFLHSVIERVGEHARNKFGPGMVAPTVKALANRLIGFEIQMGPYAVAELRATDMYKRLKADVADSSTLMFVTNTLDDPYIQQEQIAATYAPIAESRRQANEIKSKTPVTVVIGNPPYQERAEGKGGWIESGSKLAGEPPLQEFRFPGNGKQEYKLKNLYVYFWRWATWKVFDAHESDRGGVVCFITTAGYLRGPGFKGMRNYLRRTCDEGWIIDLSPERMRPEVRTRLFPKVQQPLAIGLFVRKSEPSSEMPAVIHYRAVSGRRDEKFEALKSIALDDSNWRAVRPGWNAPFTPAAESGWDDFPALSDLFPWFTTGVTSNRGWVSGPSPDILKDRWSRLIGESDVSEKEKLFKVTRDRALDKSVDPLPGQTPHVGTVADESGVCAEPVRYGYRNFDRQWIIPDRRIIDFPRPFLWESFSPEQLYLVEQHSKPIESGPGVLFMSLIPDSDAFKGSEGGRTLPLRHPDGPAITFHRVCLMPSAPVSAWKYQQIAWHPTSQELSPARLSPRHSLTNSIHQEYVYR